VRLGPPIVCFRSLLDHFGHPLPFEQERCVEDVEVGGGGRKLSRLTLMSESHVRQQKTFCEVLFSRLQRGEPVIIQDDAQLPLLPALLEASTVRERRLLALFNNHTVPTHYQSQFYLPRGTAETTEPWRTDHGRVQILQGGGEQHHQAAARAG